MGVGPTAAAHAMGVMAVASILVSLALIPGLRRSAPSSVDPDPARDPGVLLDQPVGAEDQGRAVVEPG